jgi:hypothetical protein
MNAQDNSNIQAVIFGTSFIPVVGWGISIGLGIVDYDWVQATDGTVYWDNNATSPSTTKEGETYIGRTGNRL